MGPMVIHFDAGTVSDLDQLYPTMRAAFPSTLKSRGQLAHLLAGGGYRLFLARALDFAGLVGFAFVFTPEGQRLAWLDYIAVEPTVRGQGLGSAIFRALCEMLAPTQSGLMLEVDPPTSADPAERAAQEGLIAWYQRMGARLLSVSYLFPTVEGGIPLLLLCKPLGELHTLPATELVEMIQAAYETIHTDVPRRDAILASFIGDVKDQRL